MAVLTATDQPNRIVIGDILKKARNEKGLSQTALANALGVTRTTVQNWEANKNDPSFEMIPRICALLGITIAEFLGIGTTYDSMDKHERDLMFIYRKLTPENQRVSFVLLDALYKEQERIKSEELEAMDEELYNTHSVLIFHPGHAAAGSGIELYDATSASYQIVSITDANRDADGIIEICGDSMEPKYSSGAWLYYKDAESAYPGQIVLASTSEGYVVKQLGEDGKLHSINPDRPFKPDYEDFVVHIEGIILGEVQPEDIPAKEDEKKLEVILADDIKDIIGEIKEKQKGV